MLEAKAITVKYGSRLAVAGVSLKLPPGDMLAILGPNGAGKSTLLRTLNGGLPVYSGEVLLNGGPLRKLTRRMIGRSIAVVAQEGDVRFPVTVLEFVLGGRYSSPGAGSWGWETEHDLAVASTVLDETELTELSHRLMNELSGGERQRAILARALATEAKILLLDEPTANLDLAHQAAILRLVRGRCDSGKVSSIVVTHDVNLTAEFADRVLLLKDGEAIAFGEPKHVLTSELLEKVFGIRILVDAHPITGGVRITPVHA